jgi:hypothetical protein
MKHCHPEQVALEHHKAASDHHPERPLSAPSTHRSTYYHNRMRNTRESLPNTAANPGVILCSPTSLDALGFGRDNWQVVESAKRMEEMRT